MNNKDFVQGGSLANKNGKIFEDVLIPIFLNHGYIVIKQSNRHYDKFIEENNKIVVCSAKYKSIYNHNAKTEFLIINKNLNRKIRIECKWQQSAGSVDEKIPYLYLNSIFSFEENEVILIIDGKGQKPGSIDWLKYQIDNNWLNEKNKIIRLMDLSSFISWFNEFNKKESNV